MDLVFYAVPVSAVAAKVRIALDLKRLAHEERTPPGGYGSAAYREIVPAGSVPGLVADGVGLSDSNAILEFLEEIAPAPALLPEDRIARARVRALLGFHDTRVEAAARAMFPLIKRDWRAEPGAVDQAVAGLDAALERLGDLVAPAPFQGGSALTLADCAYPVTLQMAEMLCAEFGREMAAPARIADWRGALAGVPEIARSLAIGRAAMESWLVGFR